MEIPVYNMQGRQVGSMTIDEASLGGSINHALVKQAYVRYHANRRQGSARTKGRGQIEGSTRKLYRQKGTGRARMGQIRSNLRRGGGVTFPKTKTREDYRLDMPVKMRRKANRNALLAKLMDDEVRVIDDLSFDAPRTRAFIDLREAVNISDRSVLAAVRPDNDNARLSARNLDDVTTCPADQLTCFEMLNHRYLLIAKEDLEAWLDGPSSHTDKRAKPSARMRSREEAAA